MGLRINKNTKKNIKVSEISVSVKDRRQLINIINDRIKNITLNKDETLELDLSDLDISEVTDLNLLFFYNNDSQLIKYINITGWNTTNVTTMHGMFEGCLSLEEIEGIDQLDTSNVTDMSNLFYDCNNLSSLNLSLWDVKSVTDMSHMFFCCSKLTNFGDLSMWDVSNVKSMSMMFSHNKKVKTLNLSNWKPINLRKIEYMFSSCASLTKIIGIEQWELPALNKNEAETDKIFKRSKKLKLQIFYDKTKKVYEIHS